MLTFATPADAAQAAQLMQPCLIRVVDNVRKHTETLPWRSEYLEQVSWPGNSTAEQRQRVRALAAQLEGAPPEYAEALRAELATLPTPSPLYQLRLTAIAPEGTPPSAPVTLDLWELCFAVCFQQYQPHRPATVDPALIASDGEVDWLALDEKAMAVVAAAIDGAIAP